MNSNAKALRFANKPRKPEPVWHHYAGTIIVGLSFWLMLLLFPA